MIYSSDTKIENLSKVVCKLSGVPITKRISNDLEIVYEYDLLKKQKLTAGNTYIIDFLEKPLRTYLSMSNRDIPTNKH